MVWEDRPETDERYVMMRHASTAAPYGAIIRMLAVCTGVTQTGGINNPVEREGRLPGGGDHEMSLEGKTRQRKEDVSSRQRENMSKMKRAMMQPALDRELQKVLSS